jgi:hypothetical protein
MISPIFAYRVMYMSFDGHSWETDCSVTGWATMESLSSELAGAYEEIKREAGHAYIVLTLPPGQFFDEGPARMEVVN